MKKSKPITYVTTALLVLSLCLMLLTIFSIGNSLTNDCASADTIEYSPNEVAVEQENLEYFYDSMNTLENELENNNTSVSEQLYKQLTRYTDMLNNQTYNDLENLKRLIATTENLIEEYEKYENRNISRAPYHVKYTPIIAAAIAYFNSKDYVLSAELLTYAKDNDIVDFKYHHIQNISVIQSSELFRELANGEITHGKTTFERTGNTNDDDLFYSIHGFTFDKESKYSHSIRITDKYDFSKEDDFGDEELNKAVACICDAQEAGAIVPFYINEYITDTGCVVFFNNTEDSYYEYSYLYKTETRIITCVVPSYTKMRIEVYDSSQILLLRVNATSWLEEKAVLAKNIDYDISINPKFWVTFDVVKIEISNTIITQSSLLRIYITCS